MYRVRIALTSNIEREERLLNGMLIKGYELQQITPLTFPPLQFRIYKFSKKHKSELPTIYKVASQSFNNHDDEYEYITIFEEDNWKLFKGNYANNNLINYYHFYTYSNEAEKMIYDKATLIDTKIKMYNHTITWSLLLLALCIVTPYYWDFQSITSPISILLKLIFPLSLCIILIISIISKIVIHRNKK